MFLIDSEMVDTNTIAYDQELLLALAYIRSVRNKVRKHNFSFLCSFDGRHRSGKSITACTFGWLWDETFEANFEQRVVTDPVELANTLESIAKDKIHGAYIQIDEAGASITSGSDWFMKWNRIFGKLMQTFGWLNPIVSFISPSQSFVDAKFRRMFHTYYKVARYSDMETTVTPYDMKYSTIMGKWVTKKPVIKIGDQRITLARIVFAKPWPWLIERYENHIGSKKSDMLQSFVNEIKAGQGTTLKEVDLGALIKFVVDNPSLYTSSKHTDARPNFDYKAILFGHNLKRTQAEYIKRQAERKWIEKFALRTDQAAELEVYKEKEKKEKQVFARKVDNLDEVELTGI